MTDKHEPDIDRRLREAFTSDRTAAVRIARTALAARAGRPRTWAGIAAAAAVAVIVVPVSVALWPSPPPPLTAPAGETVPSLTGSFTDGVLVVSLPDGSCSILGGGVRENRPPDGYGFVLVEGELR